jgi:gliding motility-associated-like protein
MNRKPIPLIILLIITLWCNYTQAQPVPKLISSNNPPTCNGSEGAILFNGLQPNTTFQVTYTDDGVITAPVTITSTAAGELTITGLNAGMYKDFVFDFNGIKTTVPTRQRLSNPEYEPLFDSLASFCQGGTPPVLPAKSKDDITGIWSPAIVSNQTSQTYTFTPAAGTCGIPTTLTTVVIPKDTATFPFGKTLTICHKGAVPKLPDTSTNGIAGIWSPTVVDSTKSGVYVFTATSPGCVTGTTLTVTVNPNIEPVFPFGKSTTICEGANVVTLPVNSSNNIPITGTWNPSVVSNTTSDIYTFTPSAGQCAITTTYTVTVNQKIKPTFNAVAPICAGTTLNPLPLVSDNKITGVWSPKLNDTVTTTYTFTPTAGQCADTATLTITVNKKVKPTFPAVAPICAGTRLTPLPLVSDNKITGVWSPALNDTVTTTYTFTPTAGQCADTATLTVTVNPKKPTTFPAMAPICSGETLTLPRTSNEGATGRWSPAVNNTATTTYTFTPDDGQCANTATLTITVNPNITPTFTPVAPICSGTTLAALPTTSNNGITGTWSPALNNTATTTYTFTPTAGQCATTATLTITVNQKVTPTFAAAARICSGDTLATLPAISTNVTPVTGTWSPKLNNTATTTYTFTPDPGQCALATTFNLRVEPVPALINVTRDTTIYDGTVLTPYNFNVNDPSGDIKWNNSNTAIGLPASGTGALPSFTATNMADTPYTAIITTVPFVSGCAGVSQSFKITVVPLAKDIFVPNIFSPNGDGKNEQLFIYGNYIASANMQIFNQWGQRLATLTGTHQGWDGTYRGNAQPVGVYLYVLNAVLKDGRKIRTKGSVTLIR